MRRIPAVISASLLCAVLVPGIASAATFSPAGTGAPGATCDPASTPQVPAAPAVPGPPDRGRHEGRRVVEPDVSGERGSDEHDWRGKHPVDPGG